MIAWALHAAPPRDPHIRPFSPQRDLEALANLVEVAFGEDLALTGSPMVRDLRQMALAGPLLQLARPLADFLQGFVWMEEGALVGNVSINQRAGAWVMANVAVLPEHRGRGIAGQLVDAAIAYVRRQGGRRILLQVRSDNTPAQMLYARRGFVRFDTWHELDLPSNTQPAVIGPLNPALRRVRCGDTKRLMALAAASVPAETQRHMPLNRARYRRDLGWTLSHALEFAFSGRGSLELVGPPRGPLAAYARLTTNLRRDPYELVLHVTPAQRGAWESALLDGLLVLAADQPRRNWRTYISVAHHEALQTASQFRFRCLRVLDQLVLELS